MLCQRFVYILTIQSYTTSVLLLNEAMYILLPSPSPPSLRQLTVGCIKVIACKLITCSKRTHALKYHENDGSLVFIRQSIFVFLHLLFDGRSHRQMDFGISFPWHADEKFAFLQTFHSDCVEHIMEMDFLTVTPAFFDGIGVVGGDGNGNLIIPRVVRNDAPDILAQHTFTWE